MLLRVASLGLVAIALPAASPPPDGRLILQRGSAGGAPACTSCHGSALQGSAATGAPALAGRPAAFIIARLDHYAGPAGHNATMRQVATALSPSERKAVAATIARLPAARAPLAKAP